MPNISKIKDKDTDIVYDIADTVARSMRGLSNEAKQALLTCFQKVAWIDENGQTYYDALETALYPPANLDYISAVYTQSGTVYESSSLNSLKSDLVVTAHYSDNTTETVSNYVLSGTLTVGTSTITVSYGGKTTTFNVTVVSSLLYELAQSTTLTGSNYINTNVQLLNQDIDFTILYDVTGSDTQVNQATFVHCMYEATPWPGIVVQLYGSSAYTRFIAFDSGEFKFNTTIKGNRQKCAITHEAGSNTYNITYFDGTNIVNGSKTATSFTAITNPVVIGAQLTTSNTYTKYFAGTVHDFKIYASVLSSATINEYVGG